jgi:hypothetical protein
MNAYSREACLALRKAAALRKADDSTAGPDIAPRGVIARLARFMDEYRQSVKAATLLKILVASTRWQTRYRLQ